jgi:hypothetical protein
VRPYDAAYTPRERREAETRLLTDLDRLPPVEPESKASVVVGTLVIVVALVAVCVLV